jgi:16S rRNA G966 N2-methylase RsmD
MTTSRATRPAIPAEVRVSRGDPVYMAHGYLTKVPVTAIAPFIEAFTEPGAVVLDLFAGSGMTGVAAAMLGRKARLVDISVLGRHIGTNYVNLVDRREFRAAAERAVDAALLRVGRVYDVSCARCNAAADLSRQTWSQVIECDACEEGVNYYRALEASDWGERPLICPRCDNALALKGARRVREEAVLDTISCTCSKRMLDQPPTLAGPIDLTGLPVPDVEIEPHRQMYRASALGKHDMTTIARFYSPRNLAVLAALRYAIDLESNEAIRQKLLFAFTAVLTRASKRYQWSHKRPLNAANQNYYVAMVFYEWNVIDLFLRKVEAVGSSDDFIRDAMGGPLLASVPDVKYDLASAEALPIEDGSVDYVFTDPPFGSNIFYSDMNLFQEAWLGELTDESKEAVVDRSANGDRTRTAARYELLLTAALKEGHRALKPDGWLSMVFSNSSGAIWALVQRAVLEAGFVIDPDGLTILDKGQRSVKGLASGFEEVVTVDLVLSMRKRRPADPMPVVTPTEISDALDRILARDRHLSPSEVYLGIVRECLREHWDLAPVSFAAVAAALRGRGFRTDQATGRFVGVDVYTKGAPTSDPSPESAAQVGIAGT